MVGLGFREAADRSSIQLESLFIVQVWPRYTGCFTQMPFWPPCHTCNPSTPSDGACHGQAALLPSCQQPVIAGLRDGRQHSGVRLQCGSGSCYACRLHST